MLGFDLQSLECWTDTAWPLVVQLAFDATIVLGAAVAANLAMRRRSAALRHGIWTVAIVGLLALPLLRMALPGIPLGRLIPIDRPAVKTPPVAQAEPQVEPPLAEDFAADTLLTEPISPDLAEDWPIDSNLEEPFSPEIATAPLPVKEVSSEETSATLPRAEVPAEPGPSFTTWLAELLPWPTVLVIVWGLGVAWQLLTFVAVWICTGWILRRAHPVDDPRWQSLLAEMSSRLGLRRPVAIVQSDRARVPSTAGWLRARIILPVDHATWTDEIRRVVLAHELTHVARRDVLWQMIARVAGVFYWFHPLVHLASRRLRWERELACDDAVLRLGERPSSYARHLLGFAAALTGRSPLLSAAVAMASRRPIETRIRNVLRPSLSRAPLTLRAGCVLVATAALVLLSVGAIRAVDAPEIAVDDQTMVETEVQSLSYIDDPSDSMTNEKPAKDKPSHIPQETGPIGGADILADGHSSEKSGSPVSSGNHTAIPSKSAKAPRRLGLAAVELPSGSTIEVIGLCKHPSQDKSWWKPDGSPLEQAPCDLATFVENGLEVHEGQLAREMVVRVNGPNQVSWYVQHVNAFSQGGIHATDNGKMCPEVFCVEDDRATVSVHIPYATAPWKTVYKISGKEASSYTGRLDCNTILHIMPAPASEKNGQAMLSLSHDAMNQNIRVVAIRTDGKELHSAVWIQKSISNDFAQVITEFRAKLAEIKQFRIERQPKRWVELRNISLYPDRKTQVKIVTSEGTVLEDSRLTPDNQVSTENAARAPSRTRQEASSIDDSVSRPAARQKRDYGSGIPRLDVLKIHEQTTGRQLIEQAPKIAELVTEAASAAYETGTISTSDFIGRLQLARDLKVRAAKLTGDKKARLDAMKKYVDQTDLLSKRLEALHILSVHGGENIDLIMAQFSHAVARAELAAFLGHWADEKIAWQKAVIQAENLVPAAENTYKASIFSLYNLIEVLKHCRDAKIQLTQFADGDSRKASRLAALKEYSQKMSELRERVDVMHSQGMSGGEDVNRSHVAMENIMANVEKFRIQDRAMNRFIKIAELRRSVKNSREYLATVRLAYEKSIIPLSMVYSALDNVATNRAQLAILIGEENIPPLKSRLEDPVAICLDLLKRIAALNSVGARGGEIDAYAYAAAQYALARLISIGVKKPAQTLTKKDLPDNSQLQAKGKKILEKIVKMNSRWLYEQHSGHGSYLFPYEYDFVAAGQKPRHVVVNYQSRGRVGDASPRQGILWNSALHHLARHRDTVVFDKIEKDEKQITLDYHLDEPVKTVAGNCLASMNDKRAVEWISKGRLVLDRQTFTPREHTTGGTREVMSDYVLVADIHYLPRSIDIYRDGSHWRWTFAIYHGPWLLQSSHSIDKNGKQKEELARVEKVRIKNRPAVAKQTGEIILRAVDVDTGRGISGVAFGRDNIGSEAWGGIIGLSDRDGYLRVQTTVRRPNTSDLEWDYSIWKMPEGYKVVVKNIAPLIPKSGERVEHTFKLRKQ